jgi:hypothetical protein
VPAGYHYAEVKPPPRAPDALNGAAKMLLRDDAVHAGLRRPKGTVGHKAALSPSESVSCIALKDGRSRRQQQLK